MSPTGLFLSLSRGTETSSGSPRLEYAGLSSLGASAMHLCGPFSCMNKPLDHQRSVSEMGDHHERRSDLILAKSGWGRCCEKHWLLHAGADCREHGGSGGRVSWMTVGMICRSGTWINLNLGQIFKLCLKWS